MSRGPGKIQRVILHLLNENPQQLLRLCGSTRSQRTAIARAAKALERQGKCVVVYLWDGSGGPEDRTGVYPWAAHPDLNLGGHPVEELSVARVPSGTGATFTWKGSIRNIGRSFGLSKSQIARDLKTASQEQVGPMPWEQP